jgi:hypothetical protein
LLRRVAEKRRKDAVEADRSKQSAADEIDAIRPDRQRGADLDATGDAWRRPGALHFPFAARCGVDAGASRLQILALAGLLQHFDVVDDTAGQAVADGGETPERAAVQSVSCCAVTGK